MSKLEMASKQSLQLVFNYFPINPFSWNNSVHLKRLYDIHIKTQNILKKEPEYPTVHYDVFDIDITITPELKKEYDMFLSNVTILLSFRLRCAHYKYLHIREAMINHCRNKDYITMPKNLMKCV